MAEDSPQRPSGREPDGSNQDLWKYLTAGTQLAVTVGLFAALGWWVDQKMGWSPWGVLCLGTLGIAAGMYHFVKGALH